MQRGTTTQKRVEHSDRFEINKSTIIAVVDVVTLLLVAPCLIDAPDMSITLQIGSFALV